MRCPSCGHVNRADRRFCVECGSRLGYACASCGLEYEPGEKFCGQCGASLTGSREPARTLPFVAPRPLQSPASYTPKHLAEKILTSRSALEGERKQVTVLFADVQGSVALSESVDPETLHKIMDRFFVILADGVHRFEGTVNQYTGDGIMALFGAPIAHEDHARRACYAALHLTEELRRYADELRVNQGLNFAVRMGLNSGEVVVGKIGDDLRMDYTAQGHTVGLAARMEQIAAPDRVNLTQHTASLVEGFFQLRDLGPFVVKGAQEPLRVYELQAVGKLHTRLDVSRARGFSKFVGRANEMAALEAALERAIQGNGQVVGVVGEAGLGKSRLCLEFVASCRAKGAAVNEAHCPAHGKAVPFLPLLELLRDVFGITEQDRDEEARKKIAGTLILLNDKFQEALPLVFDFLGVADPTRPVPKVDPEARQRQLFGFVRRLVRARSEQEPGILLVDDLHWIDPGSDAFLAQLVEALSGTRTLLLVNFRPEYRADWMAKSYYQQLPLVPLGLEAIRELLDHLLGEDPSVAALSDLIRERTGGNPFFVEEVVQSLVESGSLIGDRGAYRLAKAVRGLEIPATVQSVLAARIDRLPEREKRIIQRASVIGKRFSEPVLKRVAELSGPDLAAGLGALKGAEFIYEEALYPQAEYAFKHPLTQEIVYRSQLSERRAQTHGAVAQAIEAEEPDKLDERSALLAHHWEGAGDFLAAARSSRRAAEWAGFRDPTEALRHWRGVRRLACAAPESGDAAKLALAACVWILRFGWRMSIPEDEALAVFREGRKLAERSRDLHSLARLCSTYAFLKAQALEPADEAFALVGEAQRLAREIDDAGFTLRVAPDWATTYRGLGRPHEALRIIEEVGTQARSDPRVGSGIVRLRAYSLLLCTKAQVLQELGRLEEATEVGKEVGRLAREQRWEEILFWAAASIPARGAFFAGDAERALRLARQAVEVAERIGGQNVRATAYVDLGRAHVEAKQWREAKEAFERSIAIVATGHWYAAALPHLAEACLGLGDAERARATIDEAVSLQRGQRVRYERESNTFLVLARVLLRTEGIAAAEQIEDALAEAWRRSEEHGTRVWQPSIHVERATLAQLRGDDATCQRELREAHRLFTEMGATGHAERLAKELGL